MGQWANGPCALVLIISCMTRFKHIDTYKFIESSQKRTCQNGKNGIKLYFSWKQLVFFALQSRIFHSNSRASHGIPSRFQRPRPCSRGRRGRSSSCCVTASRTRHELVPVPGTGHGVVEIWWNIETYWILRYRKRSNKCTNTLHLILLYIAYIYMYFFNTYSLIYTVIHWNWILWTSGGSWFMMVNVVPNGWLGTFLINGEI